MKRAGAIVAPALPSKGAIMITRRHFLATLAATAATGPVRLWAATTLTLGTVQIDTLSDGHLVLPLDFAFGDMAPDEVAALVAKYGLPADQSTPPCNLTLWRDGTNTVLFDVGSGPDFMPTAGKITDALAALDLAPDDITHVVFTHGHPDHLWGLLDEFDDLVFANAEHIIGRAEFDYWTDPDTPNTIGEDRTTFALGAARRLEVIADTARMIADGDEVLPGITARATPGHTPGHMGFTLVSGDQRALIAGDAIGNHHIAFEQPARLSGADQDPALGATTRVALLEELADTSVTLIGFHLSGGGVGQVVRDGTAFRFQEV